MMSIIIDANRASDFPGCVSSHASDIIERIRQNRMSVVIGGKLLRELYATRLRNLLVEWVRAGRAKRFEDQAICDEEARLYEYVLASDDPHIIALARVSGCRLIYTEDMNLISDFKNSSILKPKGKIVKRSTNARIARTLFDNFGL